MHTEMNKHILKGTLWGKKMQ